MPDPPRGVAAGVPARLATILARSSGRGLCHRTLAERLALGLTGGFAWLGRIASPTRSARRLFAELHAYQRVFALFRAAAARPVSPAARLADQLRGERRRRGAFDALWAAEGIGLARAEASLFPVDEPTLPLGALVPIHAGLGLSLAARLLPAADQEIGGAVAEIVAATRARAVPGCAGVAVESLGVLARSLLPHRLESIDAALAVAAPELRPFCWHGVGRALSFLYPRLASRGHWDARTHASAEAPDDACRDAALGGLVWPLLLANLRRPEIVVDALSQLVGEAEATTCQSVLGASLVWSLWSEVGDPLLPGLIEELAGQRETVPLADALRSDLGPADRCLRQLGACEELFSLATPSLVERLESRVHSASRASAATSGDS